MGGAAPARTHPCEERRRDEERARVDGEEGADRKEGKETRRCGPTADRERVGRGPHETVGALYVRAVDERREKSAVGGIEVAGGCSERERSDDEQPKRKLPAQPERGNRDQERAAKEIGGDHRPPPVEPVGDQSSVESETQRGDAVGEAHAHDAERPSRDKREPHQGHVLERVAELACRNGGVHAAEVASTQQPKRAFGLHRVSVPDMRR